MTKTNIQSTPSNSQHHDTPNNKTHVIKFRVTAEEKASLELTCKLLNLSLSTFIRRAIHNVKIEKTVIVAGGGEENPDRCFHFALPSAARWAPTSTSLQGTSIPAVRTPSRSGRNSLTNLQT